MDDLDEKLIGILRSDGRRAIANLAHDLGVSRATVRARLEKLQERGEIVGFSAIVKGDALGGAVRAIMSLSIEGKRTDQVIRTLSGIGEVAAIHTTNGRWDLVIEISAPDLDRFDAVLARIRLIEGVAASETSLLLSTKKTRLG
ncbi:Lrp/AsnC family transcriptional regulator [Paracoccaceae bacterium GXU_MW_L88]